MALGTCYVGASNKLYPTTFVGYTGSAAIGVCEGKAEDVVPRWDREGGHCAEVRLEIVRIVEPAGVAG
jgi:hypothetical protein